MLDIKNLESSTEDEIEMQPEAVGARLREYSQVWRLCMPLKNSMVIAKAKPDERRVKHREQQSDTLESSKAAR